MSVALADAPATVVLEARELVKDYRGHGSMQRALWGVSLAVERGRFLSVMGPSGSGKSTLLHLLGGLDTPTSGEVVVAGQPLSQLSDKERTLVRRRQIGFVFQFFNLVPVLTAEENVALPAVIGGARPSSYEEKLTAVLELVGLAAHRKKLPTELSGGEQQRVAIARALFTEPAVLLADEPTGNLDSKTGLDVLALIKAAQEDLEQTVVVVTHDPRAAAFADEVLYISDGSIVDRLDLHLRGGDHAHAVLAWLQELGA